MRLDQRTLQTNGVQSSDKLQVADRHRNALPQLKGDKFAKPVEDSLECCLQIKCRRDAAGNFCQCEREMMIGTLDA